MNWDMIFQMSSGLLIAITAMTVLFGFIYTCQTIDRKYGEETSCGYIIVAILVGSILFAIIGTPLSYYMKQPVAPMVTIEVEKQ